MSRVLVHVHPTQYWGHAYTRNDLLWIGNSNVTACPLSHLAVLPGKGAEHSEKERTFAGEPGKVSERKWYESRSLMAARFGCAEMDSPGEHSKGTWKSLGIWARHELPQDR